MFSEAEEIQIQAFNNLKNIIDVKNSSFFDELDRREHLHQLNQAFTAAVIKHGNNLHVTETYGILQGACVLRAAAEKCDALEAQLAVNSAKELKSDPLRTIVVKSLLALKGGAKKPVRLLHRIGDDAWPDAWLTWG